MNLFATDKNEAGKLYDATGQFQLVIEVFGSTEDPAAKVLRRMKNGTCVIYKTCEDAKKAQAAFNEEARHVIATGELATYGFSIVIDTKHGGMYSPVPFTLTDAAALDYQALRAS